MDDFNEQSNEQDNEQVRKINIDYKVLGQHIKDACKARGFTQAVLAERMDLTIGHIGKFIRGERRISLERLAEISVLTRVPIEQLLMGCVIDEPGRSAAAIPTQENEIGSVFQTMLKGRDPRTIRTAVAVVQEIIKNVE